MLEPALEKQNRRAVSVYEKALVWTQVYVCGVPTVPFPWHTTSVKIYVCDGVSSGYVRTDLEELQSYLTATEHSWYDK